MKSDDGSQSRLDNKHRLAVDERHRACHAAVGDRGRSYFSFRPAAGEVAGLCACLRTLRSRCGRCSTGDFSLALQASSPWSFAAKSSRLDFRVGHNLALKRRAANQAANGSVAYESIAALHSDPGPSVEEQVAFSQRQRRLLSVLEVLPEQDQRCLILRAEGLKYREIAEILGISLGSVSMSLARSLGRMARAEER